MRNYTNHLLSTLVVLIFLVPRNALAQDSLKYCLTKSPWIAQCYVFQKAEADKGSFKHVSTSDDLQKWEASGTYIETKTQIRLDPFWVVRSEYKIEGFDIKIKQSAIDSVFYDNGLTFKKKKGEMLQLTASNKVRPRQKIVYKKK